MVLPSVIDRSGSVSCSCPYVNAPEVKDPELHPKALTLGLNLKSHLITRIPCQAAIAELLVEWLLQGRLGG